jgi:hypothetical protein
VIQHRVWRWSGTITADVFRTIFSSCADGGIHCFKIRVPGLVQTCLFDWIAIVAFATGGLLFMLVVVNSQRIVSLSTIY